MASSSLGRSDGFGMLMSSITSCPNKPRGYSVIYLCGRPHIGTCFGCYEIGDGSDKDFVAFCSQNNVAIIHDYEDLMCDEELRGIITKHFEKMTAEDRDLWMEQYVEETGETEPENETFMGFVLANMSHDERLAVLDRPSEFYASDVDDDATRIASDGYVPSEAEVSETETKLNFDTETSTKASLKSSPIDFLTPWRVKCFGINRDFDFAYSTDWTGSTFKKNLLKFMLNMDNIPPKLVKEFDVTFNMSYDTDDFTRGRMMSYKALSEEFTRKKIYKGILARHFYRLETITISHPRAPQLPSTSGEDDEKVNAIIYGNNGLMERGLTKVINYETDIKVKLFTHGRGHHIGMFHPPTASVKDIMDEVVDLTGIGEGGFTLCGVITGYTWKNDTQVGDLDKDCYTAYIVLKGLSGGTKGTKVIKTVLKGNVRDLSCVGASDRSTFESIINQSQKLTTLKMEDVKAVFTSLPLESLQEMETYLTKHKATANVKAQGVISFIPAIKDMDTMMSKIGATTERARNIIHDYFKSECVDEEGEVRIPLITKFIQGRIAVKKEGYTTPPVAVPSVAMPHADVHMRG